MIKKLVHFSDLHLKLFKDHDLYRGILNVMLENFREIKPDRIIFTGDLLHSKNQLTPEVIEISSWVLTECSLVAKTILIPGNHDALINNNDRLDSITPIVDNLNNPNIVYYKNRGVYEDENVSWCVYSQFQGNIPPEINTGLGFKIGLFHDPVAGLTTDLGFTFEDGYSRLNFADLDVLLCGDIHKRSVFTIPSGGKGIMIGSLIQQNYGETIKHHGYGIYDVPTNDYTFHDIKNESPFLFFEISDINDIESGKEILLNLG
jgi:DNA repair exonuclease SbcCD nuclease subunit